MTFWATWCGACRSELPELETLHRQFEGQPVQFLAVNAEGSGIAPRQIAPAVRHVAENAVSVVDWQDVRSQVHRWCIKSLATPPEATGAVLSGAENRQTRV